MGLYDYQDDNGGIRLCSGNLNTASTDGRIWIKPIASESNIELLRPFNYTKWAIDFSKVFFSKISLGMGYIVLT